MTALAKLRSAPAVDAVERLVGELFDHTPPGPQVAGGVPEIVRLNRRERARRRLVDALRSRGDFPVPKALRGEIAVMLERWARKGFEDAFADAEELELRCAEEHAVLAATAAGDPEETFKAAVWAHGRAMEKAYGAIEIRGLQMSARVYQDLEMAYVPLHVEGPPEVRTKKKGAPRKGGKKEKKSPELLQVERALEAFQALQPPRVPVSQVLAKHPRIVLVGDPGSGKTTLIAYLATQAAKGELAKETGWEAELVPLVLAARSLTAVPSTNEALAAALRCEPWFLAEALGRGRALLLVDGLDEARREVAGDLLATLTNLVDAYPGNRMLVTSRPAGLTEKANAAPKGFAQVRLTLLTREEIDEFIERWCRAAEVSLLEHKEGGRTQAEADARAAADDLKARVRGSRAVERLAASPLLCSVLCIVHRFLGQQIPERRAALYEATTNVLLYEWDRAKFPEGSAVGKLDAQAKRALLGRLARSMHDARVAELPAEEVVKRLAERLPDVGRPAAEAAALVAEIRDRSGILVERTPGAFGFSHLTFQEYLTALDVVREHKELMLLAHYKDAWWQEVIALAAGLPGADSAGIVGGLLEADGAEVGAGTMLAAECVETAIELPSSLRKDVEKRISTFIPPQTLDQEAALIRLGERAGRILVRELDKNDVVGKIAIINVLERMFYEPAIGALCRILGASSAAAEQAQTSNCHSADNERFVFEATFCLMVMSQRSSAALVGLAEVLQRVHPISIQMLRTLAWSHDRDDFPNLRRFASVAQAILDRADISRSFAQPSSSEVPNSKRVANSG